MKLNGNSIPLETQEVEIVRQAGTLKLRISAVSIGVRREFDAIYPNPTVPLLITETKQGRKSEENWHDPQFRKDMEEREYLKNIYLVYRVLAHDPNVEFENTPTDIPSLRLLAKEFGASGLSEGDLLVILKQALKASNITHDEIDKVKSDF